MLVSEASNQETLAQISEAELLLWQKLIEAKTGLWLPLNRKTFLLSQLANRVRAKGFDGYGEYYDWLTKNAMDKKEWATLVDLLTVHETRFFRDNKALELVEKFSQDLLNKQGEQHSNLRSEAVKKILAKTRPRIASVMQVWSVGCSTGEEVYSLAMILQQMAEQQKNTDPFYFGVTGTDISFPSLATARDARYRFVKSFNIPEKFKQNYTSKVDNDHFLINEDLKEKVCFMQGNLGELNETPAQFFDVIYCQNVLIYFKPERRKIILNQLVERLTRGGMLVLAPGEVTKWQHPAMEKYENTGCLAYLKQADQRSQSRGNSRGNHGRK